MDKIDNIEFNFTDDNSVGLYDKKTQEIFHSRTGALKEAFEKFAAPAEILLNNFKGNKISVLDICYGIGYNTKAFLCKYKNYNVEIDALELNNNLVYISPFISDSIDNNNLKLFLISQILMHKNIFPEIFELISKIETDLNSKYFSSFYINFKELYYKCLYKYSPDKINNQFLHNIYYNYISTNYKNEINCNNYNNDKINFKFDDARKSILNTDNLYDVVFLDAFSPQKDPRLWTINFLSELKNKMKKKSLLISYSKSTPFRSALYNLGFYAGKTILNNKDIGTVASFDKNLILNKLDEIDIELLNTRAGICFKDINMNLSPEVILHNRQLEIENSSRLSHTKFIKINNLN